MKQDTRYWFWNLHFPVLVLYLGGYALGVEPREILLFFPIHVLAWMVGETMG